MTQPRILIARAVFPEVLDRLSETLDVTANLNGKPVLTAEWGGAVAKNPFLQFTIKGAKAGDKVSITWKDNKGDTRTDEATVS